MECTLVNSEGGGTLAKDSAYTPFSGCDVLPSFVSVESAQRRVSLGKEARMIRVFELFCFVADPY